MSDFFELEFNDELFVARVNQRFTRLNPASPQMREFANRIGRMLVKDIKANIIRKKIIDTRALLNSIRYELTRTSGNIGIDAGSFGIPYAMVQELGSKGKVNISAHDMRLDHLWSHPVDPFIVSRRAHQKSMNIRPRPYISPAMTKNRKRVLSLLSKMVREK